MSGNLGNAAEVEPEVLLSTESFSAIWVSYVGMIVCPYAGFAYTLSNVAGCGIYGDTFACEQGELYASCAKCPFLNKYGVRK